MGAFELVRVIFLSSTNTKFKHTSHSVSNRLPFEDGYFDHIRLNYVAKGVPEIKVRYLVTP